MARHRHDARKKTPHHPQPARAAQAAPDRRQVGLQAFRAGRFDAAIVEWSDLARDDARVATALAEAYFRRALTHPGGVQQVADLRQALKRVPREPRYAYHLGLALHHAGDLDEAIQHYRAVLQHDTAWPGAAMVLALAVLEQNPRADITALPGHTPAIDATLAPVQALLQGHMPKLPAVPGADAMASATPSSTAAPWEHSGPANRFWYGLGLIQQGDPAARGVLDDTRPLPTATAIKVRRYYWGVAAAQAGDHEAALKAWQHVSDRGLTRPWLSANLAAELLHAQTGDAAADETAPTVAQVQRAARQAAGNPAVSEALVQRLDQNARALADSGDWAQAAQLWEQAKEIVAATSSLGSPRPLLHNLGLAYEAQERWAEAAEAWRAMLRTQPRKPRPPAATARERGSAGAPGQATPIGSRTGALTEEQWAWVRKRVVECYKNAGLPGQAVTLFRQAIKADPRDVDTRVQLVDALLANEQEEAAYNELQRILEIDDHHVEAQIRLAALHDERGEWHRALSTLRHLRAQEPDREDVRRLLAEQLLSAAETLQESGHPAQISALLKEGESLAPEDYRFPLAQARRAIEERQQSAAIRLLLERVLELAPDQPTAYVDVIDCWAVAGDMTEARAALARAEAALPQDPQFYVELGTRLMITSAALRTQLRARSRKSAATGATEEAWAQLATDLLNRAVALAPDAATVRLRIATALMMQRPELALPYAEEAGRMDPDNPDTLILVGLTLGLNNRVPEAQQTLRRAARLARQQGKTEVAQHAEELVREVASPLLRFALSMAQLYDETGLDPDDLFG